MTPHTCTNCNCPKCLLLRAGQNNPEVMQALANAWAPEHDAWGIAAAEEYPINVYDDRGSREFDWMNGNLPQQRAYNDPANPLNYGVDQYPRRAKAPILGIIPRRRPQDALEWFIVGMAGTVALSIIGVVFWIIYQIKLLAEDTGAYLTAHATQIFSGIVTLAAIALLASLCKGTGGGSGRNFSGNFTGRMH